MSEFWKTDVRIDYVYPKLKSFQNSFELMSIDAYCYGN